MGNQKREENKLTKKQMLIIGVIIVNALLIGNAVGQKRNAYNTARGLEIMWAYDPELKDRMFAAKDGIDKLLYK